MLAMVAPFMISKEHPLAMVNDVFNAILVKGNMLGDSMYYGRGAGKLPTASAVVGDVIECARNQGRFLPCFWSAEKAELADISGLERSFFVRAVETSTISSLIVSCAFLISSSAFSLACLIICSDSSLASASISFSRALAVDTAFFIMSSACDNRRG